MIYLKKADVYFPLSPVSLTFADCIKAAQKRGEVCFGVRIAGEEREPDKNYGVYLIPKHNFGLSLLVKLYGYTYLAYRDLMKSSHGLSFPWSIVARFRIC